jgi:hypothetical protein
MWILKLRQTTEAACVFGSLTLLISVVFPMGSEMPRTILNGREP